MWKFNRINKQIFEYINQDYGLTLEYYEYYKDLNSLKVFEDDFKNCRQKIIEIADSTNFFKRQISCNIETIDNNKLFLGLSNEFQLSTTDINKLFISQKVKIVLLVLLKEILYFLLNKVKEKKYLIILLCK